MSNSAKHRYRELCLKQVGIPIFNQDWWLDSVSGDNWDVCLYERNSEIIAALPYVLEKRLGLTVINVPTLSQNLGPWIKDLNLSTSRRLAIETKILRSLFSQLPQYDHISLSFSHHIQNVLPLLWDKFDVSIGYTYLVDDLSDPLKSFSSSYRNKVKNAQKKLNITQNISVDQFYAINEMTFTRQAKQLPYTYAEFKRHDNELRKANRRIIFGAIDNEDYLHSALYLTWDNSTSYVHCVGEDPNWRSSGAGVYLIYHAMNYTRDVLKLDKLDFEGSTIESVEKVRRDCGGMQVSYFHIRKTPSRLLKLILAMKTALYSTR